MTIDLGGKWNLPNVFEFGGQKIRWGMIGEGAPLVFVHGTPFNSVIWRRIIPYFSNHRRVYFYDLLGYGQSEMREGENVSLGVQNKVFAALLEHWGLESPDVVGHDFGGTTVLRAHLLDAKNYRSLTLIDPVAFAPLSRPGSLSHHARRHEGAFAELPAFVHRAIIPAYISSAAHKPLLPETMAHYAEPWLSEFGQPAFWRQIAQFDDNYADEVESIYEQIRCSVMILWGEEDRWISVEDGHKLASMIPGSIFKVIPDAGHMVQEDAPEAIVAALLGFLPSKP
jgi:pimeloyl-ACP methyl ester carboxylesterase